MFKLNMLCPQNKTLRSSQDSIVLPAVPGRSLKMFDPIHNTETFVLHLVNFTANIKKMFTFDYKHWSDARSLLCASVSVLFGKAKLLNTTASHSDCYFNMKQGFDIKNGSLYYIQENYFKGELLIMLGCPVTEQNSKQP